MDIFCASAEVEPGNAAGTAPRAFSTSAGSRTNEINRNDGGRGCYFEDPDGHLLEVITRPYGSGS